MRGSNPSLFYSTSKGAIINMTRSMAAHHGPEGIRVNCIAPGMVYTPMVYARGNGMSEELRDARRKRSLLQTEGTGWDIGNGVLYLVSDLALWVTGVIHPIDAGPRSIEQGSYVRVFNDRGAFEARAEVSEDVSPGLMMTNVGHWPGLNRSGTAVNSTTSTRHCNLGQAGTYSDNRVDVQRV